VDLHIGEVQSEVRALDDRSVLSPDVLARVVSEVIRALETRRASDARRDDDTRLWSSVRSGTGR
jgi:hypothetical protein